MNKKFKPIDFQEHLAEQLKNPEFRKLYDYFGEQLEISYQLLQLRKKHRLSQVQLAKKLRTTQSNVARMESGNQNFTIRMLHRIADVFGRKLKVEFTKKTAPTRR